MVSQFKAFSGRRTSRTAKSNIKTVFNMYSPRIHIKMNPSFVISSNKMYILLRGYPVGIKFNIIFLFEYLYILRRYYFLMIIFERRLIKLERLSIPKNESTIKQPKKCKGCILGEMGWYETILFQTDMY